MNKLILFNEPVQSVRKSQQMIHPRIGMIRLQLFSNRQITDSNDPFRASLRWTELTRKNRELLMLGTHQKIIGLILGRFLPPSDNNVPIILVDLKIILSDFSVVWGVLRVTESARKNIGDAPIANRKYLRSEILLCGGGHRGQTRVWSADYHVKRKHIQSESELTEDGSITNCNKHVMEQKHLDTIIAISSCHYQRLGLCHYLKPYIYSFNNL